MNRHDYIALLDPSLPEDPNLQQPPNLGDVLITEAVIEALNELFPEREIKRFASHKFMERKEMQMIKEAHFAFVGGTNLLFSDMLTWRELKLRKGKLTWLFPGIRNLILFGTGWGQGYGQPITFRSKILYKRILHPHLIHSTRDSYSASKLSGNIHYKTVNTSCPTTWNIRRENVNKLNDTATCLFSLTDYDTDINSDENIIKLLLEHFNNLIFFPQGKHDAEYLYSMEIVKKHKPFFQLIDRNVDSFKQFINSEKFCYVGTRLHAGIKCLQQGKDALIIGTDHRSFEMAKDINLPVIKRNQLDKLKQWLESETLFNAPLNIPAKNIATWKNQFRKHF